MSLETKQNTFANQKIAMENDTKSFDISVIKINHSIGTIKLQSNGPLYNNTVIGTLVVDGWAVTFGTARSGLGWL